MKNGDKILTDNSSILQKYQAIERMPHKSTKSNPKNYCQLLQSNQQTLFHSLYSWRIQCFCIHCNCLQCLLMLCLLVLLLQHCHFDVNVLSWANLAHSVCSGWHTIKDRTLKQPKKQQQPLLWIINHCHVFQPFKGAHTHMHFIICSWIYGTIWSLRVAYAILSPRVLSLFHSSLTRLAPWKTRRGLKCLTYSNTHSTLRSRPILLFCLLAIVIAFELSTMLLHAQHTLS